MTWPDASIITAIAGAIVLVIGATATAAVKIIQALNDIRDKTSTAIKQNEEIAEQVEAKTNRIEAVVSKHAHTETSAREHLASLVEETARVVKLRKGDDARAERRQVPPPLPHRRRAADAVAATARLADATVTAANATGKLAETLGEKAAAQIEQTKAVAIATARVAVEVSGHTAAIVEHTEKTVDELQQIREQLTEEFERKNQGS